MSVLEVIKQRQSIRAYEAREVEEEKLMTVLEAGRRAPSAVNFQPWVFIVVRKASSRAKLKGVYDREWFLLAPCIIVVCVDHQRAWKRSDGRSYADVDAAIALDHMILTATELGLGTCWIGAFNREEAQRVLGLPSTIEPLLLTPLGYPVGTPPRKERLPLDQIVHWERYEG